MRSWSGWSALIFLLVVVAGCASRPPVQNLPASPASIEAFSLTGRVAVKVENRGYSARLLWKHLAQHDTLRLLSPVGSVVGEIESGPDGATLTTGDKKVFKSDDPQSLTREVLGWDLPLAGLRYWVTGRPQPDVPVQAEQRDDKNRLTSLRQNDWQISYLDYFGDSGLPSRMALVYEKLSLRVVVEQWDLAP